jgi:hypothetical protein
MIKKLPVWLLTLIIFLGVPLILITVVTIGYYTHPYFAYTCGIIAGISIIVIIYYGIYVLVKDYKDYL